MNLSTNKGYEIPSKHALYPNWLNPTSHNPDIINNLSFGSGGNE